MKNKTALVTVTDDKLLNHVSFFYFLSSLKKIKCNEFNHIFLLYPEQLVFPRKSKAILYSLGVNILGCPGYLTSDPYSVKFLLASFLTSYGHDFDKVVYMDPDHIAFKEFNIKSKLNSFIISSEVKDFHLAPSTNDKSVEIIPLNKHFNTSIIIGDSETWLSILKDWKRIYSKIEKHVSVRYREEIAFALAAIKNDIALIPCNPSFQSNFFIDEKECSLFHYGGEFPDAKRIKEGLLSWDVKFSNASSSFVNPHSKYILNEIENRNTY